MLKFSSLSFAYIIVKKGYTIFFQMFCHLYEKPQEKTIRKMKGGTLSSLEFLWFEKSNLSWEYFFGNGKVDLNCSFFYTNNLSTEDVYHPWLHYRVVLTLSLIIPLLFVLIWFWLGICVYFSSQSHSCLEAYHRNWDVCIHSTMLIIK